VKTHGSQHKIDLGLVQILFGSDWSPRKLKRKCKAAPVQTDGFATMVMAAQSPTSRVEPKRVCPSPQPEEELSEIFARSDSRDSSNSPGSRRFTQRKSSGQYLPVQAVVPELLLRCVSAPPALVPNTALVANAQQRTPPWSPAFGNPTQWTTPMTVSRTTIARRGEPGVEPTTRLALEHRFVSSSVPMAQVNIVSSDASRLPTFSSNRPPISPPPGTVPGHGHFPAAVPPPTKLQADHPMPCLAPLPPRMPLPPAPLCPATTMQPTETSIEFQHLLTSLVDVDEDGDAMDNDDHVSFADSQTDDGWQDADASATWLELFEKNGHALN